MKDGIKKILKEILGVNDEMLEKLTAENVDDAAIEALIPTISQVNRAKWETILSNDSTHTAKFSDRGHAAGLAKGLHQAKDLVLQQLGFQIPSESEEYKDNTKFAATLKARYEDALSKQSKTGEDVKAALERAKADFEREKAEALRVEREALNTDFESKIKSVHESNALKVTLLGYASGKKIKGGLELDDILPAIEAKARDYKFEFDPNYRPTKVYNAQGQEMHNEKKDGFLAPSDILGNIFSRYIDTETTTGNGTASGANGRKIESGGNQPDTLKSQLADMEAMQN